MRDAWVLSVPHTGTRFLQRLLGAGGCHSTHFRSPPYDAVWCVPMRHPLDVARSYAKRQESIWDMVDSYDALEDCMSVVRQSAKLHLIPLDRQDIRETILDHVRADGVDVPQRIDWANKVGEWPGPEAKLNTTVLGAVDVVFERHEFVSDLYRPSGESESA